MTKFTTYRIKSRARIEGGQLGYIVTVTTDRGVKDVSYVHVSDHATDPDPTSSAYQTAQAMAESIDRGRWVGGRDPLRGVHSVRVCGKTMEVSFG
jgi:hypothetical protein